eukprot:jgi/Galph1/4302/GphlegSOOS_G3000.1
MTTNSANIASVCSSPVEMDLCEISVSGAEEDKTPAPPSITVFSTNKEEHWDQSSKSAAILNHMKTYLNSIKVWLCGLMKFAGPGWLVCIALIDPGNYEGDIQAGASFRYQLIWIIWWSSVLEVFIQILTIRLGLYAKLDLAQACQKNYPRYVSYALWVLSESAMLATDLLQVIGFAVACEILFHMPLYAGVLLSFGTTILILSLQYFNVHYLEIVVMVLVLIMAITFFIQWSLVDTDGAAMMRGWVIPSLPSGSALIALSEIGASVSPHNVFLQSAMVQTRTVENTKKAIHDAFVFNVVEFLIPMTLAFVLNLAVVALAAVGFYHNPLVTMNPQSISLIDTCQLIKKVYPQNGVGCILFGISLLTSAQTATVSATYAGQVVMEGFLNIRISLWLRNLMTRSITIIPGLVIAIVTGNSGSGLALLIASSILSAVIPFLIVPLLKFTQSSKCMGPFKNPRWISVFMWLVAIGLILGNVYLIVGASGERTLQTALSSLSVGSIIGVVATVLIGLCYLGFLGYLMWFPVTFDSCVNQILLE